MVYWFRRYWRRLSASSMDPQVGDRGNAAHAQRPWTHERQTGWNRLIPQATWKPGSQTLILQTGDAVAGYAVLEGRAFGDPLGVR